MVKTTLTLICAILLMVAIWYLGPFFGFGESRPFMSTSSRLLLIVLVAFYLISYFYNWPLFLSVALAICVISWILGPYLLLGKNYPLQPSTARLSVIAFIMMLTLLYGFWSLLLALKNNPLLLDKLLSFRKVKQTKEDYNYLNQEIRNAVNYVNSKKQQLSFFQRYILDRKPLNRLPWYMVIGPENAGKTLSIINSDLQFPNTEQLKQIGKTSTPTDNCDCLFTNDAIYIDTAGKYISHPEQTNQEWQALLKTLKKYRPSKAINGVILTISASDLMVNKKADYTQLAANLRSRLNDLRYSLGVRFPTYVIISKLDQLPGFIEYFRNLTVQQREQVWGVTFPYHESLQRDGADLKQKIKNELVLLEKRIDDDMIVRQQEEYDSDDCKKMYLLPLDFRALSQIVAEVLQQIFFASRYDDTHDYSTLRGIYFTSSHQTGDAHIVNNQSIIQNFFNIAENNKANTLASLVKTEDTKNNNMLSEEIFGRQYFLKQLFNEVIVNDQGLAHHNVANQSKYRFQRVLGHLIFIFLTYFLLNGFYHSYQHNSQYLNSIDNKASSLLVINGQYLKHQEDSKLATMLNQAHELPLYPLLDLDASDLDWHYGLYTGTEIQDLSKNSYEFLLRNRLEPQLEQQITTTLQTTVDNNDSPAVYQNLRLYLMMFGEIKLDKNFVINKLIKVWEDAGRLPAWQENEVFTQHVKALLELNDRRQYGHKLNTDLVQSARKLLEHQDVADRIYQNLLSSVNPISPPDVTLTSIAKNGTAGLFSTENNSQADFIPGIFTRNGFYQVFKKKMDLRLLPAMLEDSEILGKKFTLKSTNVNDSFDAVGTMRQQVLALYLNDYANHWQQFLENLRPNPSIMDMADTDDDLSANIYMLRAVSLSNSPLIALLQRVVDETSLSVTNDHQLIAKDSAVKVSNNKLVGMGMKMTIARAAAEKKLVRRIVDNRFSDLHQFVNGQDSTPVAMDPSQTKSAEINLNNTQSDSLSHLLNELNQQYTLLVVYQNSIRNGNIPVISDDLRRLSTEAQSWPLPLNNLIAPLLSTSYQRAMQVAVNKNNQGIEESLGQFCKNNLQGRYPFADAKEQVRLVDFERFFAAGGMVEQYYDKNLIDQVDTSINPWRYKNADNDQNNMSRDTLAMFEQAALIRQAFFQSEDSKKFTLSFGIKVEALPSEVEQLNMNFDSTMISYAHGPVISTRLQWPGARKGSQLSMTTLPHSANDGVAVAYQGPWALLRWLDSARSVKTSVDGESVLIYPIGNNQAEIEVTGVTFNGEMVTDILKHFHCITLD